MTTSLQTDRGTHFIVGLLGTTLTADEIRMLGELRPAGIIIFARNIDPKSATWPHKLRELIAAVKEAIGRNNIFVSIDHEGGRVHRLASPVTHFPPAGRWGEGAVRDVALALGKELSALGFNLDFAPVLDILTEKTNKVIGDRAFSEDAQSAARRGEIFCHALEAEGVLACGKHFPGHGGTTADSHDELPVDKSDARSLREREMLPFRRAISRGLRMVMTAHVLYPALDADFPATISKRIVTDILRGELGFTGVVISDAVEMGALSHLEPKDIASGILSAGGDMILVAQPKTGLPLELALRMADGLSTLPETARSVSNSRIVRLLETLPAISSSDEVLGCQAHLELAERLTKA